jgi:uncharacterized protein (DUF111 family)
MKKGRPGAMLCCLCRPANEGAFADLMLRHTRTLGVRCYTLRRHTLERQAFTQDTPYGPVRMKRAFGRGVERVKPEYDDLSEIAKRENLPLAQVIQTIETGGAPHE